MKPINDAEVYFNRKKDYSINLLLVVDALQKIIFYTAGSPGSYHDARVYRRSNLPNLISAFPRDYHLLGLDLDGQIFVVIGHTVEIIGGYFVIGDSAYSLDTNLLKPYPDRAGNSARVKNYNKILSATRVVVENANARLKNKWRRLKKLNVLSMSRARLIIRCCIILHNFVLVHDSPAEEVIQPHEHHLLWYNNPTSKREALSRFLMPHRDNN